MTNKTALELKQDMIYQVVYSDKVTMPINLYERIRDFIFSQALQPPSDGEVEFAVSWAKTIRQVITKDKETIEVVSALQSLKLMEETLIRAAQLKQVETVTSKQLTVMFATWLLDAEYIGHFSDYLADKFPNGVKIIGD